MSRRLSFITDRELKKIALVAVEQGWRITMTGSGHLRWLPPQGGSPVFTASTPDDYRTVRNCRSSLRRAGLRL